MKQIICTCDRCGKKAEIDRNDFFRHVPIGWCQAGDPVKEICNDCNKKLKDLTNNFINFFQKE